MVWSRVSDSHVAGADKAGGKVGRGDHAVSDDLVIGGLQFLDAVNGESRRAQTVDACPHGDELAAEIFDFRLFRGIVNHAAPIGQNGSHEQIVRRGVTRVFESDAGRP